MQRGHKGLVAATVTCAALAAMLAHSPAGRPDPASSELAPTVPRTRHPVVTVKHEQVQNARALSAVVAAKRSTAYGIAFFGDSVTVGFGASNPDRRGYVAHVSSWLRTHGKRVVATVHARGGAPVAYWEHTPIPKGLDAAIVELGTNDVRLQTPSRRFTQAYRTLTERIRVVNPRARILCLSVWPRPAGRSFEGVGVVNVQIRAVCPGTYVDITRLRNRWGIRSRDGFHPNDAGYRLIARAVESKLTTG